jgi:N-hydroxyarylamine O-acetyltransferase
VALAAVNLGAYLDRIRFARPLRPDFDTLRALHRAHLLAVPFENLDIHLGRPIDLSLDRLYDKIVRRRRGGFCYELNGLFAWALAEIGFWVQLHSARVFEGEALGPDFDHLALQVHAGRAVLADVGFGDCFLEPLQLEEGAESQQQGMTYRMEQGDGTWTLWRRAGGPWEPQYVFSLMPRRLSEFSEMCAYHQTSPASSFTRKRVCSLATATGRVTMSDMRLIETENGVRRERDVADEAERSALLRERFGIIV